MKRIFILMVGLCLGSASYAQVEEWRSLERTRKNISLTGMYVLGGWAVSNLIVNPILASETSGTSVYFYETNIAWSVVNLGLAGIALHKIHKTQSVPTWQAAFKEQYFTEQLFLVNTSLNIAFISAGIYLHEKGRNASFNSEWLMGAGRSMIFQGSFLLVFDTGMYFVHHSTQKKWTRYLQSVSLGPSAASIEIPIR